MEDVIYGIISGSVSGLSGRIYPLVLPQSPTLPAATYQRIPVPDVVIVSHGGNSNLYHPLIQIAVYGSTYGSARSNGEAVRDALNCLVTGSISASFIELDFDDIEPDTKYYKNVIDVRYWFKE